MTANPTPNPVLARLGFPANARLVIFHVDDVGMCHGSNRAYLELHEAGIVKTGSLMAPCPWSHEMISICQQRPDLDLGVHLTLTSEWANYRWGPLSTRDWESGLVDETGCFWPLTEIVAANLNVPAAVAEMRAQVAMVDAAGIEFTHIDAHMLTALLPDLFPHYIELGFEYRVPVLAVRGFDEGSRTFNLSGMDAEEWPAWPPALRRAACRWSTPCGSRLVTVWAMPRAAAPNSTSKSCTTCRRASPTSPSTPTPPATSRRSTRAARTGAHLSTNTSSPAGCAAFSSARKLCPSATRNCAN